MLAVALEQGFFLKDQDNVYVEASEKSLAFMGVDVEVYHPDMRILDSDATWGSDITESVLREDHDIRRHQGISRSRSVLKNAQGHWEYVMVTKEYVAGGNIQGRIQSIPLNDLFLGWPSRLDLRRQRLHIPQTGGYLSRVDLRVLYDVLHAIPRKVTARTLNVTVKAIEKRLSRIKDVLHHPGCTCYNLQGCLKTFGLTEFIMAMTDWFALESYYDY